MVIIRFKVRPPYLHILLIKVEVLVRCSSFLGSFMQFSLVIVILCTRRAYGGPFGFLFNLRTSVHSGLMGTVRCSYVIDLL